MFLISISSVIWDVITIFIIIFGMITGFFVGLRALLFVTIGNGIAIGLAFAFKSLILPSLSSALTSAFGDYQNGVGELIAANLATTIYFLSWIILFNIVFWLVYLIFKLTFLKNHKMKHRAVNSIGGAVLNTLRMGVVAGFVILFASSGAIANRNEAQVDSNYLVNDVANNSFMNKFYSLIDPNFPFFDVHSSDLRKFNDINNYGLLYQYAIKGIQATTSATDVDKIIAIRDQFNDLQPFSQAELEAINLNISKMGTDPSAFTGYQKNIEDIITKHMNVDFLSVDFMTPELTMMKNIINLYPKTGEFFADSLMKLDHVDTGVDPNWQTNLKPKIAEFLEQITNVNAAATMETTFQDLYNPY